MYRTENRHALLRLYKVNQMEIDPVTQLTLGTLSYFHLFIPLRQFKDDFTLHSTRLHCIHLLLQFLFLLK